MTVVAWKAIALVLLLLAVCLHRVIHLSRKVRKVSKALDDLTLSVTALEVAALQNANRIARLEAAAQPPIDDSPELVALKSRVDAVTAAIRPPEPAEPAPAPAA